MRKSLVSVLALAVGGGVALLVLRLAESKGLAGGCGLVAAWLTFGELGPLIGGAAFKPQPVAPGTPPLMNPVVRRRLFGLLVLMAASAFILIALITGEVASEDIRNRVDDLGPWGPVLLIAVLALAMVIAPIPNPPFMIAAGIVWGTFWGVVYAIIGQLLGSMIIFVISRRFGRRFIPKLVGEQAMERIDTMAKDMGPQLVFWWRMMPVSFDFAAYAAGLTTMSFRLFVLLVAVGSIVPTTVVVSFGDSFDSSWTARLMTGGLILVGVGVPATIFYRKYRKQLPPPGEWLKALSTEA